MRGTVIDYDTRTGTGLISGADNQRYTFKGTNVKSDFNLIRQGIMVDFDIQNNEAFSIFAIGAQSNSGINIDLGASGEKSKIVACLLAIFLGSFGIHKFYLGYNKSGIIMLLVWLFGFILFGIPSLCISVIGFIEGIIYISKSDQDFYRIYVQNKKEWF
ncbi:TM2 domain-containing protein [Acetobacter persici]|uniref:TM2 domain-containing protein n=1 Tax=Acetobacter persici TaxID=1076596 RepID=UPI001BA8EB86|nr:TM2 domain-containing protein [Acetobacter persici]MBS1016971.1 TM2 domain-containing protein [Acetobacter persici]